MRIAAADSGTCFVRATGSRIDWFLLDTVFDTFYVDVEVLPWYTEIHQVPGHRCSDSCYSFMRETSTQLFEKHNIFWHIGVTPFYVL